MDLNIFIVLLVTLIAGGHSLRCYECTDVGGFCDGEVTTCSYGANTCVSSKKVFLTGEFTISRMVLSVGNFSMIDGKFKTCDKTPNCVSGSMNHGLERIVWSTQCCNTDLCNIRDVPVYISNKPNGKQCYYCDGKSCFNKLKCLGNEDYCFTTNERENPWSESRRLTLKGCVSKSICGTLPKEMLDFINFSCCQGNLCNSAKSITHNVLHFLCPLFFYIMFH